MSGRSQIEMTGRESVSENDLGDKARNLEIEYIARS